jgi:hypothetical protein
MPITKVFIAVSLRLSLGARPQAVDLAVFARAVCVPLFER